MSAINCYTLENSQVQNFIPPPSYEETVQISQQLTHNTLSTEHSDTGSLSTESSALQDGGANVVCNEELTGGTFTVNGGEQDTCIDVV